MNDAQIYEKLFLEQLDISFNSAFSAFYFLKAGIEKGLVSSVKSEELLESLSDLISDMNILASDSDLDEIDFEDDPEEEE